MNAKYFCTICKIKDFAQINFALKTKETFYSREVKFGTVLAYKNNERTNRGENNENLFTRTIN